MKALILIACLLLTWSLRQAAEPAEATQPTQPTQAVAESAREQSESETNYQSTITSFCKPTDTQCLTRELDFINQYHRTPATDGEIENTYGGMWYDEPPHPGWARHITTKQPLSEYLEPATGR